MIKWRNVIYTSLTSNQKLNEGHLLDLANFLQNMAISLRRLLEVNIDLCVFCRNNNEPKEVYTSHKVKDRSGRVTCPFLRKFTCPLCGATKDNAHTIRYCPKLPINSNRNTTRPTYQMIQADVFLDSFKRLLNIHGAENRIQRLDTLLSYFNLSSTIVEIVSCIVINRLGIPDYQKRRREFVFSRIIFCCIIAMVETSINTHLNRTVIGTVI
ncbi:unnamed protein product [Heterobilharzia americana]|nr:unnamed protein product [Heterobilharzia americana]